MHYHGQSVEEIFIKVDVESLRNEGLEWTPRAIGGPHPVLRSVLVTEQLASCRYNSEVVADIIAVFIPTTR